jgi:hypothetical protein
MDTLKIPRPLNVDMELSLPEEVLFDFEKGYSVRFGFPKNYFGELDDEVSKKMKGPPYVFMAHNMIVSDPDHPDGVDLKNVPTILMHGGRTNGVWCFSGDPSMPVEDYMTELDSYLLDSGLPLIKFILACNYQDDPRFPGLAVEDEKGWTIHASDEFILADIGHGDVAQAVGDFMFTVSPYSKMDLATNRISIVVGSKSKIHGLDKLVDTHGSVRLL